MRKTKAFTLLEVIMVLVILGIVSGMSSKVIVGVYEAYLNQKALHNASLKTELAIHQLANRLTYRINLSMLARIPGRTGNVLDDDVYPIYLVPDNNSSQNDDYSALEWIGYENDGFSASKSPAWSGFCDLNSSASSFASISSIGSNLGLENTILNNLAGGTAGTPAILFMGNDEYKTNTDYETLCTYQANGCIFPVTLSGTTLTFQGNTERTNGNMIYTEFYQLAASAYAVVPEEERDMNGETVWELAFYSNYQPWNGENYTDGDRSILARNISVFRFTQDGSSLRLKLCAIERITETQNITNCKEKAVIR